MAQFAQAAAAEHICSELSAALSAETFDASAVLQLITGRYMVTLMSRVQSKQGTMYFKKGETIALRYHLTSWKSTNYKHFKLVWYKFKSKFCSVANY
jgi:hypothetical protein